MKKINIYAILGALFLIAAFFTGDLLPKISFDWFGYLLGASMFGSVFGCGNQSPRSCDDCPEDELNKIVHVAFIRKGTSIDTSSASLFASSILAAEVACNGFVIRNVSGSKAKPSTKEGKGAGKQIKRILAKEHSIDVIDFNYIKNIAFWNDLEDSAINYDMYYFTDTYGWVVTGTQISVAASDSITDDNTTFIEGSFTVTWAKKGNPLAFKADVDSLASCPELFVVGTFSNRSGSQASIVGSTISVDVDGTVNIRLVAGVQLDSAEVVDGTLPAGLEVDVTGTAVDITGAPTTAGTYEVTIKAQNACGVASDFTITFVVS